MIFSGAAEPCQPSLPLASHSSPGSASSVCFPAANRNTVPLPTPVPVEAPVAEPPAPAVPEPPSYPWVLAAKSDVEAGTMLTPDLVEWREWSEPIDTGRFLMQDTVPLRAILGSVTRQPHKAGEPLVRDGIIVPGGPGFIRAVLEPGMRAMTVEIDQATTIANLIFPGDRVDIILISTTDTEAASQAIVRDVRVLAVGSTIYSFVHLGHSIVSEDGSIEPVLPPAGDNYTLELSPMDSERVALAVSMGRLTLAMRSEAAVASDGRELPRPVHMNDVLIDTRPRVAPRVRIIRGSGVKEVAAGGT